MWTRLVFILWDTKVLLYYTNSQRNAKFILHVRRGAGMTCINENFEVYLTLTVVTVLEQTAPATYSYTIDSTRARELNPAMPS